MYDVLYCPVCGNRMTDEKKIQCKKCNTYLATTILIDSSEGIYWLCFRVRKKGG